MKITVLNNALKEKNKTMILETAYKVGAEVCFADTEDGIPEGFRDAEVIYGFAPKTAASSKNLKWLCANFAGVESLLRPGVFANEDCILTNSAGAFGVSIAEHIIMVSLMMMRKMTVVYRSSIKGEWGERLPQRSLKDARITVLGTGDIGKCFARRVKAFEPKKLTGICRSGKIRITAAGIRFQPEITKFVSKASMAAGSTAASGLRHDRNAYTARQISHATRPDLETVRKSL